MDGMLYKGTLPRVWKIEEVGDYSLLLSSDIPLDVKKTFILPNPTEDFIKEHGKTTYSTFTRYYETKIKEILHTPETLVVYFENKTPSWAKVGGEVIF